MFSKFILATLFAVVAVQAQLPECATGCVGTAVIEAGCNGITDTACMCSSETFMTSAATCLHASCSEEDIAQGLALQQQFCGATGSQSASTPEASGAEPSGANESGSPSSASGSASGSGSGAIPSATAPPSSSESSSGNGAGSFTLSLTGAAVGLFAGAMLLL